MLPHHGASFFYKKKYREVAASRYFRSEWKYIYCYLLYLYYILLYNGLQV